MEFKLLIVVALVASTQAGPIDTIRDSCSQTCPSTNKFGYRPGKSYEFDYNVKTSTSVKGASEGLSEMELTAKVHVEAVSKYLEDIRRLETNMEFTGDMNAFQTAAYFELQPLMSRISASSQWNMEGDIIGNIRIDTPFATLPYSQITATSKLQENERTSVLNIEYLPSRVLKLESSYKNQPGDLFGSVALTTPFNQMTRVAATAKFTGSLTRFRSSIALEDIHGQKAPPQ
ncbi:Vitellogenin [Mizuhopecten yessoensis]|uniref:Vitellogenin n=1 Tax=Mizuhopecten yessoensis TaxID=6573 RepID=A0A210Q0N6_MIZYE|nr:Vitellogenin [Mizuhopecten yessoensis]